MHYNNQLLLKDPHQMGINSTPFHGTYEKLKFHIQLSLSISSKVRKGFHCVKSGQPLADEGQQGHKKEACVVEERITFPMTTVSKT